MKYNFINSEGLEIAGNLEMPMDKPRAYAIFAHCFTCSKNISATTNISRKLASMGIAVLRFDFTGIGSSHGDFENTNFSSNVQDLISAFESLKQTHKTPTILIGHSLGGAAVLKASTILDEIKMVATIGAPSSTEHVSHLFKDKIDQIKKLGHATVNLAGREFKIKKQFIDDIEGTKLLVDLNKQKKAYLIMHSPIDQTVSVQHAAKIYESLKHPKSYISLDDADHLLSSKKDSDYVATLIRAWLERYLPEKEKTVTKHHKVHEQDIIVSARNENLFTQDIYSKDFHIVSDEPLSVKGNNLGLTPYQLVLSGLGSCTSMTLKMYARKKGINLNNVEVRLKHQKVHASDCDSGDKIDQIEKSIKLEGDFTETQRQRLMEIAEMCPVNKSLINGIDIFKS